MANLSSSDREFADDVAEYGASWYDENGELIPGWETADLDENVPDMDL